jgi:hypothetical protein
MEVSGPGRNGTEGCPVRRLSWLVLVLLLLVWPLTFRYTSVGVDVEASHGAQVDQKFYRLRWPGNGSLLVGRIDEHRAASTGKVQGVDLGGDFLRPPRRIEPRSTWNRLGFWWIHADVEGGDRPTDAAPHADRVWLLGVPHWLLVVLAAAAVLRGRRRPARGAIRTTAG